MKKSILIGSFVLAAFCLPSFAENKVGKVTGISVDGENATLTVAVGHIDPFAESGFTYTGETFTETVPLDIPVEVVMPHMKDDMPVRQERAKMTPPNASSPNRNVNQEVQERPQLEVKKLGIDQLVSIVYAEDGNAGVEKIQVTAPHRPRMDNERDDIRVNYCEDERERSVRDARFRSR